MANLYGEVISDRATSTASRCGTRSIRAAAQSWEGSLIAIARHINGKTTFELEVNEGSSAHGDRIFKGTLDQLIEKLGD